MNAAPARTRRAARAAITSITFITLGGLFVLPDVLVFGSVVPPLPAASVATGAPSTPAIHAPLADPVVVHPTKVTPLTRDPVAPSSPAAAKTTHKTTVKPAAAPATKTGLVIAVNVSGGQSAIDKCAGAILYAGDLIAQHNYCGGTRFYTLKVGSLVTLAGAAIIPGLYRVVTVAQNSVGSSNYGATPALRAPDLCRRRWRRTPLVLAAGLIRDCRPNHGDPR